MFRSLYRLHAFNGDPHPGNYLFDGNGVVTFLDFGLVKRYDPAEVGLFEELIRSMVLEHDIAEFRATLEAHSILRKDAPFGDDDVREYFGHFYEFVMEDEVVTMSPEYASETVRRFFDLSGPYAHVAKAANVPPAFVITQRINLGLARGPRAAARDRELAAHRRGAVADRRRAAVDTDGRSRSRLARGPGPRLSWVRGAATRRRPSCRGSRTAPAAAGAPSPPGPR